MLLFVIKPYLLHLASIITLQVGLSTCLIERVSLSSSRVGVIGPNGAGKSTMIKLLTARVMI